jgi:acyl carrier protein
MRGTDDSGSRSGAFEAIRRAICLVDRRLSREAIDLQTSVIDDLGMNSLRFVDLTLAIEEALGIPEFPMQEWYDEQASSAAGRRFTVDSLVTVGLRCVARHDTERRP